MTFEGVDLKKMLVNSKNKRKVNKEKINKFVELMAEGYTYREIGKKLGISRQTCCDWNKEFAKDIADINKKQIKDIADKYKFTLDQKLKLKRKIAVKLVDIINKSDFNDIKTGEAIKLLFDMIEKIDADLKLFGIEDSLMSLTQLDKTKVDFTEFCTNADYPKPFEKQIEMQEFAFGGKDPRLLLGARGYGKTDYVTILGVAYNLYLDNDLSVLIITKSRERNTAILHEIHHACVKNGLKFEVVNAGNLRLQGYRGKDNNVSAVTVGTSSLRGRHPKIVICDDPITIEDTSPAIRARVKRVYDEITKLTHNVVVIGQPAHFDDLYQNLRPVLAKKEYPYGVIPELDVDLEAQRLAGVDEASIQASYFLKILSENEAPFGKIKMIDKYPIGDSVAFIDPSFEGGDYTAISIVRAHFDGIAIVGFCYKRSWDNCIDEMIAKIKKYKVKRLAFETNSLGETPIKLLRENLSGVGVVGYKNITNKHQRIMNAGSYAHLMHLTKESEKNYIDQIVKYEYNVKNDDAPDSLASCLHWLGLIRGK